MGNCCCKKIYKSNIKINTDKTNKDDSLCISNCSSSSSSKSSTTDSNKSSTSGSSKSSSSSSSFKRIINFIIMSTT